MDARNLQRFHFALKIIIPGLLAWCAVSGILNLKTSRLRLLIGVLSSRDHFEQRQAIRDSWWNFVHEYNDVEGVFVVGRTCPIPPLDRSEIYKCRWWNVSLPQDVSEGMEFSTSSHSFQSSLMHRGFSFYVHHPIVLTHLVIHETFLSANVTWHVTLKTPTSADIITSVSFRYGEHNRQPAPAMLLPKGFEAVLVLESESHDNFASSCFRWPSDQVGLISFRLAVNEGYFLLPEHKSCVPVGFTYLIHDLDGLQQFLAKRPMRLLEWTVSEKELEFLLDQELEEHGDLLLVDVDDVYRNLPTKLLQFFQWASSTKTASFILKADDDTFLWIPSILEALPSAPRNVWWGNFRFNWAVQKDGKWREEAYSSLTYPPFACGSAYALGDRLVFHLAQNAPLLQRFQGEDVSMGIWLSAVMYRRVQDSLWSCGDSALIQEGYSRGELNLIEMNQVYLRSKQCGNLC